MLQKSITAQFVVVPTTSFFNDMVAALNSGIIVSALHTSSLTLSLHPLPPTLDPQPVTIFRYLTGLGILCCTVLKCL